ncbi:MAG: hypothetical protein LBR49_01770 [Tannerella sp.]|jgi:predicted histone-like DNA-binding protein|nr:hypothetical protein [Tannerella sp.]
MAVKYVTVTKGNPRDLEEPRKWYAITKNSGTVGIKTMDKAIARTSGVDYGDTKLVLKTLTKVLGEYLAEGKIIRMGSLGSFQIRIKGGGATNKEQLDASWIKTKQIVFRPGRDMKKLLKELVVEKA